MGNHQTVQPSNEDCVLTLSQFASNSGISLVTLRRTRSLIDPRLIRAFGGE